ncbi:hypothetical protein B0H34DRAFT_98409 [Crassisporium funariophilum]|nr:hypothetical protein B0H34DRAFT_98409 [Crassisporium funariophilum]
MTLVHSLISAATLPAMSAHDPQVSSSTQATSPLPQQATTVRLHCTTKPHGASEQTSVSVSLSMRPFDSERSTPRWAGAGEISMSRARSDNCIAPTFALNRGR